MLTSNTFLIHHRTHVPTPSLRYCQGGWKLQARASSYLVKEHTCEECVNRQKGISGDHVGRTEVAGTLDEESMCGAYWLADQKSTQRLF